MAQNTSGQTFYWLRDSMVTDFVRMKGGMGFVGSDRVFKEARDGVALADGGMPIPGLRFAVAGLPERRELYFQKMEQGEPCTVGTSYPELAKRMYPAGSWIVKASGCVEALPALVNGMDAIVELVRSGESLRQNDLAIFEDNIQPVELNVLVRSGTYHKPIGEMV